VTERKTDPELPPEQAQAFKRARLVEWITIAYLASSAALIYVVMGSSQAMKTSFYEELVTAVPAIAFLITSPISVRAANRKYPYGYHTVTSIGHLTAATALVGLGTYLIVENAFKLISQERTTIGGIELFGSVVWAGWPMLLALLYALVPPIILGRIKERIAPRFHDKLLFADARMMRAGWMTEAAAAVGVIGVGLGYWWTDLIAALLVACDIARDGLQNMRAAITDLMKEMPKRTDDEGPDPIPREVEAVLQRLDWVQAVEVRMREDGRVFFGEAYAVPRDESNPIERMKQALAAAKAVNWRVHDLTVMLVDRLPRDQQR
jgi:divalent metal cation (Fe/Co/Zn/Cd) transporter